MAKKVKAIVKLQLPAAKATPGQSVGSALGPHGIPTMEFLKQFNERTKGQEGMIIPVIVTAYEDRTFTFITKTPPAAMLIKKACGIEKGSPTSHKTKVAKITKAQLREIAELKLVDLNAGSVEAAMRIIAGSARSMGVTTEE
ncbi:MAG: 50S ribosomal protein L11 [Tenericutes bacterium HGW-Tenericutes-4]|jgi:large subunit ribosomal protein L11|nr:MAG: 50S ribosomal protein L11 [Tenericutes bacterium HGW-Tenericutes-4]